MRTTVTIDDEIFSSARELSDLPASDRKKPSRVIQKVLSDYVRQHRRGQFFDRLEREGIGVTMDDLARMREKPEIEAPKASTPE